MATITLSAAEEQVVKDALRQWMDEYATATEAEIATHVLARMEGDVVHLELDAPTSLHGNGAASFTYTTRDPAEVTCELCLHLWDRHPKED